LEIKKNKKNKFIHILAIIYSHIPVVSILIHKNVKKLLSRPGQALRVPAG